MAPVDRIPIRDGFGFEVPAVDVRSIGREQSAELLALLRSEGLLIFPRQSLDERDLGKFARGWGDLVESPNQTERSPAHSSILTLSNLKTESGSRVGGLGSSDVNWHSDSYYLENRFSLSFLYCILPAPEGGTTYWANTRLAYEALPEEERSRIEGLEGLYRDIRALQPGGVWTHLWRAWVRTMSRESPFAVPLVLEDPGSGRRSLYVSERVIGIRGMPRTAALELRDRLITHTLKAGRMHGRRLRTGDLVVYDNSQTIHRREAFRGPRVMKATRVLVSGSNGSMV